MKIGLLGGTFDPVHLAHLRVAEEVREKLSLGEIWFIPAGVPPHKRGEPHLPFEERFKLVTLAIADHPAFRVLDLEGRREGPSYTVETLHELRGRHPGIDFYFILGLDAFAEIETWHAYRHLPSLATLVVVNRDLQGLDTFFKEGLRAYPDFTPEGESLKGPTGERILYLPVTPLGISSTLIRQLRRSGGSIRYLVPESVRLYIEKKGLYL